MRHVLIITCLSLVAGCAYAPSDKPSPEFGQATDANTAVQTAAASEETETDGQRIGLAVTRYRTDRSKEPERLRASQVSASSGAGEGPK